MRLDRILILLVTATFAACGESTGVTGDELTEGEAAQLATAVLANAIASAAGAGNQGAAMGPQRVPVHVGFDVDFVAECALGGTVDVEASLDIDGDTETEAGRIEYTTKHVHHGCVVESDEGMLFTLDGAPSVSGHVVAESDGAGSIAWVGSLEGNVAWATEGRSGTCPLVIEFSGAVDVSSETAEFVVEGSVCRASVDYHATIG